MAGQRVCGQRRQLAALCCGLVLVMMLYRLLPATPPPLPPPPPPPPNKPALPYHDHFAYLLNADVCGAADEPARAVIVVHSDPRHPEVRRAIRESLPAAELAALGVRRAFMVADASTAVTQGETTIPQRAIVEENVQYGDLVQGDFHDSYHNLTFKHIMALDWAVTFCPQARYIVKMDDDIAYNVYELMKVLQLIPPAKYLGGNAFPAAVPYRNDSKWVVSVEDWPYPLYPPYVSGWLYIATRDVARALVLQSTVAPFFWIDDLFVTGVLAEQLPITIRGLNRLFVTSPACTRLTVEPLLSGPQPPADVYAANFVVGPTDRDLDALKAFNRLARYCARRPCLRRSSPSPLCVNSLS